MSPQAIEHWITRWPSHGRSLTLFCFAIILGFCFFSCWKWYLPRDNETREALGWRGQLWFPLCDFYNFWRRKRIRLPNRADNSCANNRKSSSISFASFNALLTQEITFLSSSTRSLISSIRKYDESFLFVPGSKTVKAIRGRRASRRRWLSIHKLQIKPSSPEKRQRLTKEGTPACCGTTLTRWNIKWCWRS